MTYAASSEVDNVVRPPSFLRNGKPVYVVHLPKPDELPPSLRVKFFLDHDTFAAYLRVWVDLGYQLHWPDSRVAVIQGFQ